MPSWASGSSYIINAKATDNANNAETPGVVSTWIFDNIAPSSLISVPANGATLNALAQISGTAIDATAGVNLVQVSITPKQSWWHTQRLPPVTQPSFRRIPNKLRFVLLLVYTPRVGLGNVVKQTL